MLTVYESEQLRSITGPAIRPGGFELTEKGVSLCRLPKNAYVLDVGCGAGATTEYLIARHGLKAFGLDLSELLLGEGLRRNRCLPLIRGDASFIPVSDARLSAVFCECVPLFDNGTGNGFKGILQSYGTGRISNCRRYLFADPGRKGKLRRHDV